MTISLRVPLAGPVKGSILPMANDGGGYVSLTKGAIGQTARRVRSVVFKSRSMSTKRMTEQHDDILLGIRGIENSVERIEQGMQDALDAMRVAAAVLRGKQSGASHTSNTLVAAAISVRGAFNLLVMHPEQRDRVNNDMKATAEMLDRLIVETTKAMQADKAALVVQQKRLTQTSLAVELAVARSLNRSERVAVLEQEILSIESTITGATS